MPRHDPTEKTKTDILKTAVRMFSEKGWDDVNVEDVVKEVGVTRGAFYHYFKSREDLIYAVIVQMFYENNPFTAASEQQGLNALEKLRFALKSSLTASLDSAKTKDLQKMYDNPAIFKSFILSSVNISAPYIEQLLTEGNKDGSLSVAQPKQVAQVLTVLSNIWLDTDVFHVSYEEYTEKVLFLEKLCELMGMRLIDSELRELLLKIYEVYQRN